jgi:hypothetical protein
VLRRSLGVDDDVDTVIEIHPDGTLCAYEESTARKRRGSTVRKVSIDIREILDGCRKQDRYQKPSTAESWVDSIVRRIPIADFGNDSARVCYRVKVWLLQELKRISEDGET